MRLALLAQLLPTVSGGGAFFDGRRREQLIAAIKTVRSCHVPSPASESEQTRESDQTGGKESGDCEGEDSEKEEKGEGKDRNRAPVSSRIRCALKGETFQLSSYEADGGSAIKSEFANARLSGSSPRSVRRAVGALADLCFEAAKLRVLCILHDSIPDFELWTHHTPVNISFLAVPHTDHEAKSPSCVISGTVTPGPKDASLLVRLCGAKQIASPPRELAARAVPLPPLSAREQEGGGAASETCWTAASAAGVSVAWYR